MSGATVRRLGIHDNDVAWRMFALLADLFEVESCELSPEYLSRLLSRPEFWAIAALDGSEVVGGLTAHVLPMTRCESSEAMIYDIAVREEYRRRGVGRQLVAALREGVASEGITVTFVLADDEDTHALDFYRALGGAAAPVTAFTFSAGGEAGLDPPSSPLLGKQP